VASIDELRSLLAVVAGTKGPSRELDEEIAGVLGAVPAGAVVPPWSASTEEAMTLFKHFLHERPIHLDHDTDPDQYSCWVKLYGNMPETAPYAVQSATTAPIAVLAAMIDTLIAVKIDHWS
jgi:hypothetical protein